MKLLADAMLGRLAKWLRILGHDTIYFAHLQDQELVRLARAEDRLLLTRDRDLTKRKGFRSLLVESDRLDEQLGQLLRDLALDVESPSPRCACCNTTLEPLERRKAKGRVPPYVYRRHREFTLCPRCDRVYWRGTHWQRMRERIQEIGERRINPS
jgi:uncharacterized protein with PIN domain